MRSKRDLPDALVLCQAAELSDFGFFEKPTVRQMLQFFSRTVVARVEAGQRITIEQEQMKGYQVHAFVRKDGLAATTTCDKEYPARAAFNMLSNLLEQFAATVPGWQTETRHDFIEFPPLADALKIGQDPAAYDRIIKIQNDLDDTTVVLHQTIDNLLERGEKLDSLVERSDDLSRQSKMFYKQARKTNSCCLLC
eukprot:CAMPEP_0119260014 /NCGR_PEP_ID=MMETSP1329-20130426/595_1 /TAXON_ID=114041 /ORGANISM="Genus nov. species nov., Strain RCC1024" /LENGTH=194 /DNA_ID=CAMNT_0007259427 /DNA_START=60 /DNA_END=644 /DNA_ORIENTATION=+